MPARFSFCILDCYTIAHILVQILLFLNHRPFDAECDEYTCIRCRPTGQTYMGVLALAYHVVNDTEDSHKPPYALAT